MASSKPYLDYILEQLAPLDGISYRAMMGEYILYYNGRIVGGVYDDRLLLKPTPGLAAAIPSASLVSPYEGARPMLLVVPDDSDALCQLVRRVYAELPAPRHQ